MLVIKICYICRSLFITHSWEIPTIFVNVWNVKYNNQSVTLIQNIIGEALDILIFIGNHARVDFDFFDIFFSIDYYDMKGEDLVRL
jgi:hypothetical protein